MTGSQMSNTARLEPQYLMALGVIQQYDGAQHVVDYLADQGFPVQNLEAVGTELRPAEPVTGRLTRGKIAVAGALSGLWIGLFVGIAFSLFGDETPHTEQPAHHLNRLRKYCANLTSRRRFR